MKTAIECKYKGMFEVPAGSFEINGRLITYNKSYKIVFDQLIKDKFKECNLKVPQEIALNTLPNFKPYDNIVINLDISIYSNKYIAIKVVSIEKK